jgi:hypothetical protein
MYIKHMYYIHVPMYYIYIYILTLHTHSDKERLVRECKSAESEVDKLAKEGPGGNLGRLHREIDTLSQNCKTLAVERDQALHGAKVCVCVCVFVFLCTQTHPHTYVCIYMHTYIHNICIYIIYLSLNFKRTLSSNFTH